MAQYWQQVTYRLHILHRQLQLHRAVPRIGWRLHAREGRKGALLLLRGVFLQFKACSGAENKQTKKKEAVKTGAVCPLKCVTARWQRTRRVTQLSAQHTCGQCARAWRHTDLCGGAREELMSHISAGGHWHTSSYRCPLCLRWYRNKPIIVKVLHGPAQQALLTHAAAPLTLLAPDWSSGATAAANCCIF